MLFKNNLHSFTHLQLFISNAGNYNYLFYVFVFIKWLTIWPSNICLLLLLLFVCIIVVVVVIVGGPPIIAIVGYWLRCPQSPSSLSLSAHRRITVSSTAVQVAGDWKREWVCVRERAREEFGLSALLSPASSYCVYKFLADLSAQRSSADFVWFILAPALSRACTRARFSHARTRNFKSK